MKGIVRGINVSTGKFFVDYGLDRFAVFHIARGGLPRGGEYVRWNDTNPVTMVMGESSGTILIARALLDLGREAALRMISA